VVLTGTAAPGYSTAAFKTLAQPTLGNDGRVLFRASVAQGGGVTAANDTGLWAASPSGVTPVAIEGHALSGQQAGTTLPAFPLYVAGPLYQTFDSGGRVAFASGGNAVLRTASGSLELLAKTGATRPDGGTWGTSGGMGLQINPSGRFVLRDATSIYTGTTSSDLTLVTRAGQTLAGRTIESVQSGAVTRDGRILFHANADPTVTDERYVAFAVTPTNPPVAARLLTPGDAAAGVTPPATFLRSAGPAYANTAGDFVVTASLAAGPVLGTGMWKGNLATPGTLTKVVAPGDPAPGVPDASFLSIRSRGLSDSGRTIFTADLQGGSVTNLNRASLWAGAPGGGLQLLARQGNPVALPGFAPDIRWGTLGGNMATNANDQALVGSLLIDGSSGTPALFGYDPSIGLVPLVKKGDVLEVSPGQTRVVQSLTIGGDDFIVLSGGTNDGSSVALNDAGEVVYRAVFTDGSQGIFTTRIPVAGDATYDGIVDTADFDVLRAHLWGPGGRGEGDFDGNGIVNFTDFQILERNFGRHPLVGTARAGVTPVSAVPEPGTQLLVIGGVMAGLGRPRRRGR
jgi:hypothetical protein